MRPIEFEGQNTIIVKDQPPYLPLPAYVSARETISCWSFTWRERLKLLITGRLWWRQLNFCEPLQAQAPQVDSPFVPVDSPLAWTDGPP